MSYRLGVKAIVARTITSQDATTAEQTVGQRSTMVQALYRPTLYDTLYTFPEDQITRVKGFYGNLDLQLRATCALPSVLRVSLFVYKYLETRYEDNGTGGPPTLVRTRLNYPAMGATKIPSRLKIASLVVPIAPGQGDLIPVHRAFTYTMKSKRNALVNWNGVSKITTGKRRRAGAYADFTCEDVIACAISLETDDPNANVSVLASVLF